MKKKYMYICPMNDAMRKIEMVDLKAQFQHIKAEVMAGIETVCENTNFINGAEVNQFAENLKSYTGAEYVIPCANGTDAIQIALMALGLKPGDEVIVPTWTYVATAEVIALLQLKPIFVDANPANFNLDCSQLEKVISPNTKAIVPVHLYGQCCDMEEILAFAKKHNIHVIEDTAQAIGSVYQFKDGTKKQAGTMGDIGTTSFFPSKNLGCYGDGGAIFTNSPDLFKKLAAICNHGQLVEKYYHDIVGVNSRLDTIQAVILNAKLKQLSSYEKARNQAAAFYTESLAGIKDIECPEIASNSSHVFHQYTMKIKNGKRNELKEFLQSKGIPSMIYYPLPLHHQKAYSHYLTGKEQLQVSEKLANEVISLPIHTEMDLTQLSYITETIKTFFI